MIFFKYQYFNFSARIFYKYKTSYIYYKNNSNEANYYEIVFYLYYMNAITQYDYSIILRNIAKNKTDR